MAIEVRMKKKLGNFQLDIDFKTDENRIGILGASGCGKSMTLKCIAGIETPDEGRIIVDGTLLYDSAKKISLKPQKRHIGYLFQNYALFPTMTVEENIAAGLQGGKEEKRRKVAKMMESSSCWGLESSCRENSLAASSRGWLWQGSWPMSRKPSCWTSRSPHWMNS